jgi:hypothetical protein
VLQPDDQPGRQGARGKRATVGVPVRHRLKEPPVPLTRRHRLAGSGSRSVTGTYPSDRTASRSPNSAAPQLISMTSRVRRLGLRLLPPHKLLPDRQPAYVA